MPTHYDDDMEPVTTGDIREVLEKILSTGKPDAQAVIKGLEVAGFSIQGPGSDEPMQGEGEDDTGERPERNPMEGTGGTDTKAMGEPMSIDQIGAELFEKHMGGGKAPAT